ncbi:Concanavalin A-like lectin/glucanase domain-containing protein [Dioscorea alata]|uniref:Concanavalin A-like lectin/glucanase domain-containing protein n=1 Tax=Dioscorea alata TaxID=55571 RepID=A0ACB7VU33_DIOAL|nr:Concanavalin A-like lectin/glucanase domain-containing protein [Dioscorea alata]
MKRPRLLLLFLYHLSCLIPGILSSRVVTLGSIEIFDTHEWFGSKPNVYFQCHGENRTFLPDVKQSHLQYTFKGEESWQPLTELNEKKCKRCGLFEMDSFKPDDVFDEWELCPGDFIDGKYVRSKDKEVNATFICLECSDSNGTQSSSSNGASISRKSSVALVVVICLLTSILMIAVTTIIYKYWQKRKREQDQARFVKLFEEGNDIEDELGLDPV